MSIGLCRIHDNTRLLTNLLIQELKCLTKDEIDFIITQIRYSWDEFNCTWTNNYDQMFKWVDQIFKLNDQKTKLTWQSACCFSTGRNWTLRLMNLNDKSVKIAGKTYIKNCPFSKFLFTSRAPSAPAERHVETPATPLIFMLVLETHKLQH